MQKNEITLMKRNIRKPLFLLLGAMSALSAVAYDVKVDDAYYDLNKADQTATLTYKVYYNFANASAYEGDVVIPSTFEHDGVTYTVTAISRRAFFYCHNLTSIELPATITQIGDNAFFDCKGLKSVNIPEKLVALENGAFQNCSALESIALPPTLVNISSAVFSGCSSLAQVQMPTYCQSIANNAFLECTSLTELNLPRTLTKIDHHAFFGCTNLQELTLPDGLNTIGVSAFEGCTSLKKVEFGKSISTIDVGSFSGCKQLVDVYFSSPNPPAEAYSNAFSNTPRQCLHLPNEAIEAYRKQDIWQPFEQILPLQCAQPTLQLGEETITFASATNLRYAKADEVFVYSIDVSDLSSGTITDEALEQFGALQLTYDVRVRTTAAGCMDSEETVASLCWLHSDNTFDGDIPPTPTSVDAPAVQRPVLATSCNGELTLTGLSEGTDVVLYDLNGRKLDAATASADTITLSAPSGQIVVVRAGHSSFKVRVN